MAAPVLGGVAVVIGAGELLGERRRGPDLVDALGQKVGRVVVAERAPGEIDPVVRLLAAEGGRGVDAELGGGLFGVEAAARIAGRIQHQLAPAPGGGLDLDAAFRPPLP